MPRLDGMGPKGNGPKTGRGAGNCTDIPKKEQPIKKKSEKEK